MFYKAIKDGLIVDVWDGSIVFVRRANGLILRCTERDAPFGVLASDSSVIYALDGSAGYETITLKAFEDAAEYEALRAEIDAQRTPEYIEPDDDEQDEDEHIMTGAEMRAKIAEQEEQIAMLTDCILEMSEIIYG